MSDEIPCSDEANLLATRFKSEIMSLVELLGELANNCVNEGVETLLGSTTLMIVRGMMLAQNPHQMLVHFVKNSTVSLTNGTYWDRIAARDFESLSTAVELFDGVPSSYLTHIAELLKNRKIMTPALEEKMWDVLRNLCILSIRYIHDRRGRKWSEEKGRFIYAYTYFGNVKLLTYVQVFDVRLEN